MKTRGEKAVREVPAARSQAPAAPVAPAAEAAPVAVSPDAERHRSEVKVDEVLGAALKKAGHGPYELVPGRYPGAVALPDVLAKLGTSPEGQAAVHHLLDEVKTRTGIDVSPEERAALLSNPSGATRALEVTPRQMSLGVLGSNAAYEEGKLKPKAAPVLHLPQHGFDLAGIAALDLPRSAPQPKQVAPGLFYGSLPGTLPEAQVKQNQVLAETFDRLSRNASAADGEKFSVTYRGHAYTRLDGLLAALKADGHQVKVTFEQRAANFANLKTQVPGASPVQWLDVPAPLMLRTGVRDGLGHEAVVPAAHSEMIVTLTSGPQTQGPRLDAELRYFQGTDGTGFFAKGGSAEPKWLGRITHAELDGDDAEGGAARRHAQRRHQHLGQGARPLRRRLRGHRGVQRLGGGGRAGAARPRRPVPAADARRHAAGRAEAAPRHPRARPRRLRHPAQGHRSAAQRLAEQPHPPRARAQVDSLGRRRRAVHQHRRREEDSRGRMSRAP
ncbi:MAG: hypothetical protein IPJ65_10820 [Archangiaceae bacterium]|nr:hypothetical protein [Archangiaceae bacterium]